MDVDQKSIRDYFYQHPAEAILMLIVQDMAVEHRATVEGAIVFLKEQGIDESVVTAALSAFMNRSTDVELCVQVVGALAAIADRPGDAKAKDYWAKAEAAVYEWAEVKTD